MPSREYGFLLKVSQGFVVSQSRARILREHHRLQKKGLLCMLALHLLLENRDRNALLLC